MYENCNWTNDAGSAGRLWRAVGAADLTPHRLALRVYYEDTDLAGIVYYANYLKFIERGRSEMNRAAGVDQVALRAQGRVFAVRRVEADYLAPARFDDLLEVQSAVTGMTGARILLNQAVWRGTDCLFRAAVTLVCLTNAGTATRIPADIRQMLGDLQE